MTKRAIRKLRRLAAALAFMASLPLCARSAAQTADGEIRDPFTGATWRLARDAAHPGAPARLVPVLVPSLAAGETASSHAARRLVIHEGERIVIEEHTAALDARLEAVALGNAARGEELRARLRFSGAVVRIRALATGSAALDTEAKR